MRHAPQLVVKDRHETIRCVAIATRCLLEQAAHLTGVGHGADWPTRMPHPRPERETNRRFFAAEASTALDSDTNEPVCPPFRPYLCAGRIDSRGPISPLGGNMQAGRSKARVGCSLIGAL